MTVIPPTPQLDSLDPDARHKLDILAALLVEQNKVGNLTSILDPVEIRLRHLEDSLKALPFLRERAREKADRDRGPLRIIDIGSGAGFPGLPLAAALPECQFVSLEATGKKVDFQKMAAAALGLTNFTCVKGRAEEWARDPARRERFDAATARAVAPLPILLELMMGLVARGGYAIAWKGSNAEQEIVAARPAIKKMGGGNTHTISYPALAIDREGKDATAGEGDRDAPIVSPSGSKDWKLVIVEKTGPCPFEYPRRHNLITRRPL
jgi:16S rRNA (guanine527-N7)-methyltransferase